MKEIILTIGSCNECPHIETDLNSGDDYCTHSAMGCIVIPDAANIMQNCPLLDEEVMTDDEG